jgi:hypothetical protein
MGRFPPWILGLTALVIAVLSALARNWLLTGLWTFMFGGWLYMATAPKPSEPAEPPRLVAGPPGPDPRPWDDVNGPGRH